MTVRRRTARSCQHGLGRGGVVALGIVWAAGCNSLFGVDDLDFDGGGAAGAAGGSGGAGASGGEAGSGGLGTSGAGSGGVPTGGAAGAGGGDGGAAGATGACGAQDECGEAKCTNGIDDDGDSFVDCADWDCGPCVACGGAGCSG